MQLTIKDKMAEIDATTVPSTLAMNDIAKRHMRRQGRFRRLIQREIEKE